MHTALSKTGDNAESHVAHLLRRAQIGDTAIVEELRRVLDLSPELRACIGDLAKQAELSWTELACGGNPAFKEVVSSRTNELRRELLGPSPTVLERLLVDRVVTCWIQVHHADRMCARPGLTAGQQAVTERSLDRAQRRYTSAIRSLATVRRLLLPAVQVNIARQQVNVAGT